MKTKMVTSKGTTEFSNSSCESSEDKIGKTRDHRKVSGASEEKIYSTKGKGVKGKKSSTRSVNTSRTKSTRNDHVRKEGLALQNTLKERGFRDKIDNLLKEVKEKDAQIATLKVMNNDLDENYENGVISKEDYSAQKKLLSDKKESLEKELVNARQASSENLWIAGNALAGPLGFVGIGGIPGAQPIAIAWGLYNVTHIGVNLTRKVYRAYNS